MSGAILLAGIIRQAFSVLLNRIVLEGEKYGSGSVQTTQSVTATPVGGTAPYTYVWTEVAGSGEIVPTTPTSATTKFQTTFVVAPGTATTNYKCVVTDANALVVDSPTIPVTLECF